VARLPVALLLAVAVLVLGPAPAHGADGWVWPLRGEVITPYRNGGDPYAAGQHRGIDIAGAVGAPVVAARAGTVRFAGTVGDSGLTVAVRTSDARYDTSYLHLSSVAVKTGQHVAAGRRLGAVGTTGRRSATRPHLHFGVRDAGSRHGYHDPLDFLPPPARPRPAPRRPPLPVGAPARPSPVPLASLSPRSAPRAVPRSVPRWVPRGIPERAPRPLPALRPLPRLHGAPAPAPIIAPARRGAPARVPEAGPVGEPAPARRPLPATPRHLPHGGRDAPGPDVAWALACLGLLLAAALMGTGGEGARSPRELPARLGALLRPLVGRG